MQSVMAKAGWKISRRWETTPINMPVVSEYDDFESALADYEYWDTGDQSLISMQLVQAMEIHVRSLARASAANEPVPGWETE